MRRIRETLENAGYMFAEVIEAIETLPDAARARVRYLVEPGPVAVFDTLVLHNYQGAPEDSLAMAGPWTRRRKFWYGPPDITGFRPPRPDTFPCFPN